MVTVFRKIEFSFISKSKKEFFFFGKRRILLVQNLCCFSSISKTSGMRDEPALRFPTCKLPKPPSPRKRIDSIIVKLFL
jgi:hypothetical protein